ncbi:MAG: TIGR01777 family protein [Burkholderiales bacterium]|nr:MAG: TIGR01777 family protein [Burkholderiales bacterium]
MNSLFILLSVQAVMGAFDNLWHHELQAQLPQRASARRELGLHLVREAIYGIVFIGLAWWQWQGAWAVLLAGLLATEVVVTLADFLEEDRSRTLPPFERVLHTLLTISYGLFLALMAPLLWRWVQAPTQLLPVDHGVWAPLLTLFGVGVLAWSARNLVAWRQLGRVPVPAAAQLASMRRQPAVLVTGATGFVGQALVAELCRDGRRVIALSRDRRQARAQFGPGVWVVDDLEAIPSETRIDAIVHLAGARVLGLPWTAARRRELLDSRVGITQRLVALMRRLDERPRVFVSASAVGFYGAVNDGSPCTEARAPQAGEFQSDLCAAIEHEARRAEALGVRVVRLRFGVVLGREGGAYPMQALAARLGLGARLGTGQQPTPWLHRDDAVGLVRFALEQPQLAGAVNAVAPDVPCQADFARALAQSFGRRAWLSAPAWPLRQLAGEMSTILLDGQRAVPAAALAAGYRFRHPTLTGALADLA